MKEHVLSPLDLLNSDSKAAREHLWRCCGSTRWVDEMIRQRPFRSAEHLYQCAAACWRRLGREDWLEAFSRHPRIGEPKGARAADVKERGWAEQEQSGAAGAKDSVRASLAQGNHEYEAKFGHVFLVCATGKSGEEMLDLLRRRLKNSVATELTIAAGEQEKITRLRLEKLLSQ